MKFGEKLRMLRRQNHVSQAELAKRAGVSPRTIYGYEAGGTYPRSRAIYARLAEALNADVEKLLPDGEWFGNSVPDDRGDKTRAEILTRQMVALCASGELEQEDMDAMLKAIQDAYWAGKAKKRLSSPGR